MKISTITAVILAGGRNTRFRKEKSLLKINGDYLIDLQIAVLEKIFEKIIISTGKSILRERYPDLKMIEDEYASCGPLGGIHAAMKAAESEAVFIIACDMPFLSKELIIEQAKVYKTTNAAILVPRHKDGIEPLHAIYSITNLPLLEKSLNAGNYSVRSFYRASHLSYLDLSAEYIKYFYNINTQSDLQILS